MTRLLTDAYDNGYPIGFRERFNGPQNEDRIRHAVRFGFTSAFKMENARKPLSETENDSIMAGAKALEDESVEAYRAKREALAREKLGVN